MGFGRRVLRDNLVHAMAGVPRGRMLCLRQPGHVHRAGVEHRQDGSRGRRRGEQQ
jgi:hypothetical protein